MGFSIRKFTRWIDREVIQPTFDIATDIIDEVGEFVFGTPTVYSVQVQYTPLISNPPDTYKQTLISSVVNKVDITKAVAQNNVYTYYTQTRNSYNYAKYNYTNGLPEGTLQGLEPNRVELQIVLDNLLGTPANIELAMVDYLDPNYYVLKYLGENTDFDKSTGILATHDVTKSDGSAITEDLYLHSAVLIKEQTNKLRILYYYYTDELANEASVVYKDYFIGSPNFNSLYYQVIYYAPLVPPSEINDTYSPAVILAKKDEYYDLYTVEDPIGIFTTDVDAADTDLINWAQFNFITALQLGYAIGLTETEVIDRAVELGLPDYTPPIQTVDERYFLYDVSTNTYPELFTSGTATYLSPFLPIYAIKDNKINLDTLPTEPLYKSTKKGLDKLNVDMTTILEAVDDPTSNPDADLVTDVFVMNVLDIRDSKPSSIRYLIDFFKDMLVISNTTKTMWDDWFTNETDKVKNVAPYNLLEVNEANYNIKVIWNYIDVKPTVLGSIGSVGTVTSELVYVAPYVYGGGTGVEGEVLPTLYAERSKLILREQISLTQYTEIEVNGLLSYSDVRSKGIYRQTIKEVTTDTTIYFPIAYSVLSRMVPKDRTELCYTTLVAGIYAIKETELEWYETSAFNSLLEITLLTVAVLFALPTGGQSLTLYQATVALVEYIVYTYITNIAFEELAYQLGGDIALILATAAAIYAISQGDLSKYNSLLPDAKQLLDLSTQMFSATSKVSLRQSAKLQQESLDLTKTYEEFQKELEELLNSLGSNDSINYYDIIKGESPVNTNETPTEFYNRTVGNSLNVAELSLNMTNLYNDLILRLPDVQVPYSKDNRKFN